MLRQTGLKLVGIAFHLQRVAVHSTAAKSGIELTLGE